MMEDKELRKAGLKVTHPRIKILNILERGNPQHLSAENLYRILLDEKEDINLATVYRVLSQFESAGLIEKHNFESGQAVYEISRGGHHDHIVCLSCGNVEEFYDPMIEKQQEKIAKEMGFIIKAHSHHLYVECTKENCAYRNQGEAK